MAHRHGLAGKYGKAEAARRYRRFFMLLIAIVVATFIPLGFAWGFWWASGWPLLPIVAMLAILIIMQVVVRRLDPYLDKLAKERINFLRGGQGEALIAWILEELDDNWHIFNGLKLESASDIDHVLVGPGGLYCISTKSHRGLFTGTPTGLLHNGKPSDFAQQVLRQTMNLKERLTAMMGSDVPWIQPVLAVPFGYTETNDANGGKVWLVHQENITDRLAPEKSAQKLSREHIARVVKVLQMLHDTAATVYQRPTSAPTAG